ncbi:MAG: DUF5010 domain-containing protein [Elusimicrobia bacterium]|nr:DUF5010 domain-containing protein [Elusimicrobiota bacterium]
MNLLFGAILHALAVPVLAIAPPEGLSVNGFASPVDEPAVLPRRTTQASLQWAPVAGAREYHLRVDTDDPQFRAPRRDCNPHALCLDHVATTVFPVEVRAGYAYKFWVHAADEESISEPAHGAFYVGVRRPAELEVDGHPAEFSPKLPAATRAVTLSWGAVPGAKEYQLRVDTDDPGVKNGPNDCGPHMLCKNHVPANGYRMVVSANHAYTWWVHAVAANGEAGDPTGELRFTVGEAGAGGLPPPPGPYAAQGGGSSFSTAQKLLMTYHFYWYDKYSGAHMRAPDALQDHPASVEKPPFSWKSQAWYEKELSDLSAAGVDVMLPVYWGFPNGQKELNEWSNGGLETLVAAQRAFKAKKLPSPKIGMFYDTSTLTANPKGKLDLTQDADREFFWGTVRDFFSLIPPEFRARIGGRPVVVFYASDFAAAFDAGAFKYLRRRFKESFGEEPFLVPDVSWRVEEDATTQWGASLLGSTIHGIAQIGPGADDRALHRTEDHVRDRQDGNFYARNWEAAAGSGRNIVAIETWNEFHEGTDIADSAEYGTMYIALTHRFANLWRGKKANAEFVYGKSAAPSSVTAGQAFEARVTMKNTGDTPWSRAAVYRLGSQEPQDNERWGPGRVELDEGELIPPGGQKTFTIKAKAPQTPGKYPFHWRMVQENIKAGERLWPGQWFGATEKAFLIEVKPAVRTAQ